MHVTGNNNLYVQQIFLKKKIQQRNSRSNIYVLQRKKIVVHGSGSNTCNIIPQLEMQRMSHVTTWQQENVAHITCHFCTKNGVIATQRVNTIQMLLILGSSLRIRTSF